MPVPSALSASSWSPNNRILPNLTPPGDLYDADYTAAVQLHPFEERWTSSSGSYRKYTHLFASVVLDDPLPHACEYLSTRLRQTCNILSRIRTNEDKCHPRSIPHRPIPPYTGDQVDGRRGQSTFRSVDEHRERDMIGDVAQSSERGEQARLGRFRWSGSGLTIALSVIMGFTPLCRSVRHDN